MEVLIIVFNLFLRIDFFYFEIILNNTGVVNVGNTPLTRVVDLMK